MRACCEPEELQVAMPVDIVLLGLHGAMLAQDCLGCEGEFLERVRHITGQRAIVGATLDPHSHLLSKRTINDDLITVFKEYSHTDFVDIATDLVQLAHRTSIGEIAPRISQTIAK